MNRLQMGIISVLALGGVIGAIAFAQANRPPAPPNGLNPAGVDPRFRQPPSHPGHTPPPPGSRFAAPGGQGGFSGPGGFGGGPGGRPPHPPQPNQFGPGGQAHGPNPGSGAGVIDQQIQNLSTDLGLPGSNQSSQFNQQPGGGPPPPPPNHRPPHMDGGQHGPRHGPGGGRHPKHPGGRSHPGGPPHMGRGGPGGPHPGHHMNFEPLTDEQMTEVMDVLKVQRPELAEQISALHAESPEHTQMILARHGIIGQIRSLLSVKQVDERLYELKLQDMKYTRETAELAQSLRGAKNPASNPALNDLRTKLAAHFQVRQEMRERELSVMEDRLASLRELLTQREQAKNNLIEERIKELTGINQKPQW